MRVNICVSNYETNGDLGCLNTDGCGEYLDTEHCMTRSYIIFTIHHNLRDDKVRHT